MVLNDFTNTGTSSITTISSSFLPTIILSIMFIGIFYLFITAASGKAKRLNMLTAALEVKSLNDNKVRDYINSIRKINFRGNRHAVKAIRLAYYKINRVGSVDEKLKDELLNIIRNYRAIELD